MGQLDWDIYFLKLASIVATKSKDHSSKVGCVLVGPSNEVISSGYNGLCRGEEYTPDVFERPIKYWHFEHAERNACYNAARIGTPLLNSTAYVVVLSEYKSGITPCIDCTRALIQCGIKRIVEPSFCLDGKERPSSDWSDSQKLALEIIKRQQIQLDTVNMEMPKFLLQLSTF